VADSPQERRRQDRDAPIRSLYERIILIALGLVAFVGALVAIWWLWTHSGIGSAVRDGSPNWAPDGRLIFASDLNGQADLVLADRVGNNRTQLTNRAGDEGGPTYSSDGNWIAFWGSWDGNPEIYVRQAGTEVDLRRTHNPAIDRAPAWSRDGKQIVFMSNRDNKDFDIYRMNVDGSNVERLTTGRSNGFPEYSPDGGQLLLHIDRDTYIMSLVNRGLRRVTYEPPNGMHPTWSPDGLHIAFMSWRNGQSEIFTSRPDGSEQQRVVTMPSGDAVDPRWSPDGRSIAFVHVPGGIGRQSPVAAATGIVFIVELDSGRLSRVSR
jgi:Tol biopolymer transport system component